MEIFRILGFCLCAAVLLSVLRQYNPSFAVVGALAGCAVLLLFSLQLIGPVLDFVRQLSHLAGVEHLDCVLKAVAIALVTQSAQEVCVQSGQTALAGRVELAGKAAVLLAALPLFRTLADTLAVLL